jgi:hypothetical protein
MACNANSTVCAARTDVYPSLRHGPPIRHQHHASGVYLEGAGLKQLLPDMFALQQATKPDTKACQPFADRREQAVD